MAVTITFAIILEHLLDIRFDIWLVSIAFPISVLTVTIHLIYFYSSFVFFFKLAFPEFHFETEAKVDFPSACM